MCDKQQNSTQRPLCSVSGCCNVSKLMARRRKDGSATYSKYCNRHHGLRYGRSHRSRYVGMREKKDYCENIDGRLGFVCTSTIIHPSMLSVDHIYGDRKDNRPESLQTLCLNCHSYKTITAGDHMPKPTKPFSIRLYFSPMPNISAIQSLLGRGIHFLLGRHTTVFLCAMSVPFLHSYVA